MLAHAPGQSRLQEQDVVAQSTLELLALKPHSVALQVMGLSVLPVSARCTWQYWSAAVQYKPGEGKMGNQSLCYVQAAAFRALQGPAGPARLEAGAGAGTAGA
jgi:hypothetical protein